MKMLDKREILIIKDLFIFVIEDHVVKYETDIYLDTSFGNNILVQAYLNKTEAKAEAKTYYVIKQVANIRY